jgi:CubicO group peptidase (beta-lactamase class C family)
VGKTAPMKSAPRLLLRLGTVALLVLASCSSDNSSGSAPSSTAVVQAPTSSAAPATTAYEAPTTTAANGGGGAVTQAMVDAAVAKIDGVVDAEMKATGVPGVAVGLVYNDKVAYLKGYGVREVGKPETIDADTVFQLASMSKPISSTAIAALVGKGVIKWTDPAHTAAPDLVFSEPYVTDHVTFADLYSHRSGLPGGVGDSLEEIGYTRDQILQRLRFVPLNPFRITYAYTNFGMTAGGDAAAKAAGVSFEDLMDQQLFQPAGMTESSARYADFLARSDRATIHARIDGTWAPGPTRQPDAQAPAGGISSSIKDMATWARLQLGGGKLDGKEIAAADALATTHTPQILRSPLAAPDASGAFYGLGWNIDYDHLGYTRWSHSGAFSNGAATTVVLIPKEDLGVVVLTNGMPIGAPEAIADTIVDDVVNGGPTENWSKVWADRFAGLFVEDPALATPPTPPTPAQPESAYVGSYANDFYGTFDVTASGPTGLSLVKGPAKLTYPLTHWDADTFTYVPSPELPHVRTSMKFVMGTNGQATAIDVGDVDGTGLGTMERVP